MKAIKFVVVALMFSIALPLSTAHASFFDKYAPDYQKNDHGYKGQDFGWGKGNNYNSFDDSKSFNFKPKTPTCGDPTFQVNAAPEPVGTVLFLLGAFIMGTSILRRRLALAV